MLQSVALDPGSGLGFWGWAVGADGAIVVGLRAPWDPQPCWPWALRRMQEGDWGVQVGPVPSSRLSPAVIHPTVPALEQGAAETSLNHITPSELPWGCGALGWGLQLWRRRRRKGS